MYNDDEHRQELPPHPEPVTPPESATLANQSNFPTRQKGQRRTLVWVIVASMLVSLIAGFAGGYLASRAFPPARNGNLPGVTSGSGVMVGALNAAAVARIAGPSVVAILTETLATRQGVQQYVTSGAGSGIIYSADGLIVTNQHVIANAQRFTVYTADNQRFDAQLIAADARMDLAILRIQASGLTPARLGDSSRLSVGDPVVAIGNPLGELGGTVTNGIISALDRPITIDNETMNLLQTNAAVNPGNSGGGLFDRSGNLIGVVVAKTSAIGIEGIAFAIPINNAKPIIDELISRGFIQGRIDLGMTTVDVTTQQQMRLLGVPQLGVYIAEIRNDGTAANAGLKVGDCILTVEDARIQSGVDVTNAVEKHKVGDQVPILVLRDGQQVGLTMTLQEVRPVAAITPTAVTSR